LNSRRLGHGLQIPKQARLSGHSLLEISEPASVRLRAAGPFHLQKPAEIRHGQNPAGRSLYLPKSWRISALFPLSGKSREWFLVSLFYWKLSPRSAGLVTAALAKGFG